MVTGNNVVLIDATQGMKGLMGTQNLEIDKIYICFVKELATVEWGNFTWPTGNVKVVGFRFSFWHGAWMAILDGVLRFTHS